MADHRHCDECIFFDCSAAGEGCFATECLECGLRLHGCKMNEHLEEICREATVYCINEQYGCDAQVKRKDLPSHLSKCPVMLGELTPSDIVQCEYCSVSLSQSDVLDHAKVCMEIVVPCTNKPFGCIAEMKRKALNHHLQHCPASVIDCNFSYTRLNHDEDVHEGVRKICKTVIQDPHQGERILPPDEKFLLSDIESKQDRTNLHLGHKKSEELVGMTTYPWRGGTCCSEYVRRDEFTDHWKSHIDFNHDLFQVVRHCPMFPYGCLYSMIQFHPAPSGWIFDYNPNIPSFTIRPSSPLHSDVDEQSMTSGTMISGSYAAEIAKKQELLAYGYGDELTGSADVLGQLPMEVIVMILSFCDSLSLWALSQVNRYLRGVCETFVVRKGVVLSKWERNGNKWDPLPKTWLYSKVFSYCGDLLIQVDTPSMGDHLKNCEVLRKLSDSEKYQQENTVWNVHPTYPPFARVPLEDVDFKVKRN